MKILYIAEFLHPYIVGGSARYATDFLNGLAGVSSVSEIDVLSRGHKHEYSSPSSATDDAIFANKIRILQFNLTSVVKLIAKISTYDVVIGHHPYYYSILGLFVPSRKLIYFFHGPLHKEYKSSVKHPSPFKYFFKLAFQKLALNLSSKVYVLSKYMKDELTILNKNVDCQIIGPVMSDGYIGFNRNLEHVSKHSKKNLICVRRLTNRTGVLELCEQLSRLHLSDVHLHIVGKGELASKLESRFGSSKEISLYGFMSEREMFRLYSGCNIAILPTLTLEGFGLVVLEAFSFGIPVIVSSASGGAAEFIRTVDENFIYDINDDESLIRAIDFAHSFSDVKRLRAIALSFTQNNVAEKFATSLSWG